MASAADSAGYEPGPAANGGTVAGAVRYVGSQPPRGTLEVTKHTAVCGATATLATDLVVGPSGGLQYAVSLRGIAAGKPFDQALATLDQRGCERTPHVVVVPAGRELTILNSDGALHNIHTAGLHPDMAANPDGGMEGSPADSDGCQITATTGARTQWAWCLGLLATLGALLVARGARR